MRWTDVWWLMKEIWPWTIGITGLGALLGYFLRSQSFGLVFSVICMASIPVCLAFWTLMGWTKGGVESTVMGIAFMGMPAAIAAMFSGAVLVRLISAALRLSTR